MNLSKKLPVSIILLLILSLFLGFQLILIKNVTLVQYDEAIFLDVAQNINKTGLPIRSVGATGRLYFEHTPLYVYLLSGLMTTVSKNVVFLRLVTTSFAVASIILAYIISRDLVGKESGLITALLIALNPFWNYFAYFIYMEIPFCFFLLIAVFFLLRWQTGAIHRGYYLPLVGVAIAISVLFKEIGLVFLAAAIPYIIFSSNGWQERIRGTLWLVLPTVLALGGWLWWAYSIDASQLSMTLGRWFEAVHKVDAINARARFGIDNISWLKTIGRSLLGWSTVSLFLIVLIAALIRLPRQQLPRLAWLFLLYIGLASAASLIMSLKELRHIIGLIPVMALAIGVLTDWPKIWKWICKQPIRLVLGWGIMLLLGWSLSPLQRPSINQWTSPAAWLEPFFGTRVTNNDAFHQPLKEAGEYLQAQTDSDTVILVVRQAPVVGYYAKRSYVPLYTRPFTENMALLEQTEYLVFDENVFWRQTASETEQLLQYIYDHFEVAQSIQANNHQILIYKKDT